MIELIITKINRWRYVSNSGSMQLPGLVDQGLLLLCLKIEFYQSYESLIQSILIGIHCINNKHCEGSCELLRWTVWNRLTVYNQNHVNHKNHLKFIFTFPDKILLIIFIFGLSEIFIWQTDCKSNLWLYKCTQGTETGFTTLDTVQVYRINIIKS